jgi:cysteinyl-tRNA synthetase
MHNGLLNLRGEKMSKSTGHFYAIEDIMREFPGEVIRFYLLSTHFRSGTEFSRERLKEAEAGLERIRNVCLYVDERIGALAGGAAPPTPEATALGALVEEVRRDFLAAMDDDFNGAEAIGHVFRLVREVNRARVEGEGALLGDAATFEAVRGALETFDSILGLFKGGLPKAKLDAPSEVTSLVADRERARKERAWARADEIRKRVLELGYVIEDRPDGPALKPAK